MSDDIDEPLHNHFVVLILRLFKLTQYVHIWSPFQGLKVVMRVTLSVLPNALWIFMVILIMLYMFGCYAAYCFQDNDAKYFDSLFHAIIAGFSIITRRWSIYFYVQYYGCDETYSEQEIANYGCDPNKQPVLALLVFPIFILTVSYIFLQLLLAVICEKWNLVSAKVGVPPIAPMHLPPLIACCSPRPHPLSHTSQVFYPTSEDAPSVSNGRGS